MRSCFIESENLIVVQDPGFVREREEEILRRLRRDTTEMTRRNLKEQRKRFKAMMAVTDSLDLFF